MLIFGRMIALVAMLGWSAWYVICNVYEFAPRLDPFAFGYGWLLVLLVFRYSFIDRTRPWGWALSLLAALVGVYLLLIHQGATAGTAMRTFVVSSMVVLVAFNWRRRSSQQ